MINQGHVQWKSLESAGGDDDQFLLLTQDCFLTQHVLEPIRGGNVLDLILSSQNGISQKWNKSENYRPVSLTSGVCKLLEPLIRDHMVEFLVKRQLINTSQRGFLKARSCLTFL